MSARAQLPLSEAERVLYRASLRTLRRLGMEVKELTHITPRLSKATIKRYVAPARPEPRPHKKTLTIATKRALTTYWVRRIARGRRLPASSPSLRLLDILCRVHVGRCLERTRERPVATAGRAEVAKMLEAIERAGVSLDAIMDDPAELLRLSRRACELGTSMCLTAPAALAALIVMLRLAGDDVDAWTVAQFLTLEVGPDGWWLRRCPRCGVESATESKSQHYCEQDRAQRPAEEPYAPLAAISARQVASP